MFIDVVTKSPKILTYKVPPELIKKVKVGQIILVPIGNNDFRGLVFRISQEKESIYQIKTIKKIITPSPLLFKYQLELIEYLNNYYCSFFHQIFNLIIPPKIEYLQNQKINQHTNYYLQPLKPILLWDNNRQKKENFYWQQIKKCLNQNKQIIILYPQIDNLSPFINYLLYNFPHQVTILHGAQSKEELTKEWLAIKNNERKIIIGSQKPLFMSYPNLGLIIINEENSSLYKQERQPKYFVPELAQKITQLTKAQLILESSPPSINSFYYVQRKKYQLVKINHLRKEKNPKIILVDLNKLPYEERIISPILKKELDYYLAHKKSIILFLNRKGTARYLSCSDCGFIPSCPQCNLPFVYYQYKKSYLLCPRCNIKQNAPDICPSCLSFFIEEKGLGIGMIKKQLSRFYPLAKIQLLDKEIKRDKLNEIITDYLSKKIDILIGTQIILNYPEFTTDFLGVISADTEIQRPDFKSEEKTFLLLTKLKKITKEKGVIQSYYPTMPCIKYGIGNNFLKFYQTEIEKRKLFLYPPFVQVIKIIFAHRQSQKCQLETKKIMEKLKKYRSKEILIIGPLPCFVNKIKGLCRWQIIIKLLTKNGRLSKNQIELKKELIHFLKPEFSIDINPESLIN